MEEYTTKIIYKQSTAIWRKFWLIVLELQELQYRVEKYPY